MKQKLISIIAFIFLVGVLGSINSAVCLTGIPATYSGKVSDSNGLVKNTIDLEITTNIGIIKSSGPLNSDGTYSIDVFPCLTSSPGEIVFYLNGMMANEEGFYAGRDSWGDDIKLDLTFDGIVPRVSVCGNGVLDAGEQCDGNLFSSGVSCSTFGYDFGNLTCNSCGISPFEKCYLLCGNGKIDPGETCSNCALDVGECKTSDKKSISSSNNDDEVIVVLPNNEEEAVIKNNEKHN